VHLAAVALILGWNAMVPVQDGVSKGGLHWHMTARAEHGRLTLGMDVRDFDGWFVDTALSRRVPLTADRAEDAGPRDEAILDGFVYRTVATVQVQTDKRTLTLHPRPAPARARKRWPDLDKARFFAHFFASDDAPRTVTALAADGRPLDTITFR
jgi:hypothetical protein